ncbi:MULTISPECIES: type VII secretion protein EccCa [Actinomyces]|uniref:Type VII secretion protein EccCa n=1 Tax=Actinomyces respiraculi TaxID=2744574 RepID=A0A7T0LKM1_9ACTO|nr:MULTISPECIES: type VII secretion protein EccCa [Actinomyces]QPL05352.1 type VII secretion protein EccCa [Actinomyces respiraculi]
MIDVIHRPGRIVPPALPPEPVVVPDPPQLTDTGSGQGFPFQMLVPLLGAGSSMLMMTVMRANPVFALLGAVMMVITAVAMISALLSRRFSAARTRSAKREQYLDKLLTANEEATALANELRRALTVSHPGPQALARLATAPERRWERRRYHPDFLSLRVGVGDIPVTLATASPSTTPTETDPVLKDQARAIVDAHCLLRTAPAVVDLDSAGIVSVVGPVDVTRTLARSLVVQAAVLHAPEDLRIALAYDTADADAWDSVSRLPHLRMHGVFDGPVAMRRTAPDVEQLSVLLKPELAAISQQVTQYPSIASAGHTTGPRTLAVIEDDGAAHELTLPDSGVRSADLGITELHLVTDRLNEPSDPSVRLTARPDGTVLIEDLREHEDARALTAASLVCTPEPLGPAIAEGIVRTLTPLSLGRVAEREDASAESTSLEDLLGVEDPRAIDIARAWAPRSARDFLRVPIGSDDSGRPLLLDLKESAQLGQGPHGLCVGATGSGKSELLRTLVTALATTHSPEDLAMILVDYKGGAAFAPFETLPHVVGLMDNLADDPGLTERAHASIQGEVVRRQRQLRDAGSSPDIGHYRRLRAQHPEMAPMPHLFLIIDEFGELLTANPDFVDLLLTIGRIGRSIGVHLLLSSQRIEGGKLRGLDTYLSYRICLRTFTESESSTVIGTNDAFHLPSSPGYGYLKVDTTIFTRFRSGFVSGPADELEVQETPEEVADKEPLLLPVHNGLAHSPAVPSGEEDVPEGHSVQRTVVDVVVEQLTAATERLTPVWLEPLPRRLSLGALLNHRLTGGPTSLTATEAGARAAAPGGTPGDGAAALTADGEGTLSVPIGLLDDPAQQRQDEWRLDLTVGGGHVSVLGAPQSGRTTFLWTLAASAALCLSPRRLAFYGLDATGGGLSRLVGLPNVGGIATRGDRERMRRVLEEMVSMLNDREAVMSRHRLDSLEALRHEHAAGRLPELPSADVVLLLDGLGALRADFSELEDLVDDVLRRGGGLGVHVVATLSRANDLRMAQQPLVGTKLELRLNDPQDSAIARKLSQTLRADAPGRVLRQDKLFAHIALPLLEGEHTNVGAGLEALARRTVDSWPGARPAQVRLLPEVIDPLSLPDAEELPDLLPLGLMQDTMEPACLDPTSLDPHLVVLGDSGCGKTTVLRGVVETLVERHTPAELVVGLYDVRRGVLSACPEDYLGGHATSSATAIGLSNAIASELAQRSEALASGSHVEGPRIVLVVDDYEILAAGGQTVLAPVLPYLPSARDLHLTIVLARPVAGIGSAMFEQALQALRDTGATCLLMDGDRSEGQIFGMRPEHLAPGRGWWIRRGRRPRLCQVADFSDPTAPART